MRFEAETGIRPHEWHGVYWARWSDAIAEAGHSSNQMQGRLDQNLLIEQLVGVCRHYGRVPTFAELSLYRRQVDPGFPGGKTFEARFSKADIFRHLRQWVSGNEDSADIAAMLPDPVEAEPRPSKPPEGMVYLIRSGQHFKIGRSDELERRVKEIRVALPEAAELVHVIRTDDPPGIEAYWHRRFADRRANGEWFKLTTADVSAFRRRKFQ